MQLYGVSYHLNAGFIIEIPYHRIEKASIVKILILSDENRIKNEEV